MHPARPKYLPKASLALLLFALAFAPSLILVHESIEHDEHTACELSELAIDVNASGSLESTDGTGTPTHSQKTRQPLVGTTLQYRKIAAFAARAPPCVPA